MNPPHPSPIFFFWMISCLLVWMCNLIFIFNAKKNKKIIFFFRFAEKEKKRKRAHSSCPFVFFKYVTPTWAVESTPATCRDRFDREDAVGEETRHWKDTHRRPSSATCLSFPVVKQRKTKSCLVYLPSLLFLFPSTPHPTPVMFVIDLACAQNESKTLRRSSCRPPIFLIFRVQNNKHPSYLNALHFGYLIISVSMQTSSFSKCFHSKFDTPVLQEFNCVRK